MSSDPFKRPALPLVKNDLKRARFDDSVALVPLHPTSDNGRTRYSNLSSPIMLLTGHEGEIFASKFSPDGTCLASAGYDMKIFLWNVFGDCENFSTLSGHKSAVMDLHFNSDASHLYTCSTDKTVRVWDMDSGFCLRKIRAHGDFVNSCHPARRGPEILCSGSDDGTILVHDIRKKGPVAIFENVNKYQITSVSFNDTADQIISGGIDNVLKIWDLRRMALMYVLSGHSDIITYLSLNPEGTHILSNSMDCTARIWDIRPFASAQRCQKILTGHQHNFEKNLIKCAWSPDGQKISCGSSDRYVYIWDIVSKKITFKLPGHQGSVNSVDLHPKEPIVLSAGSDKRIFMGELSY